jgi:integrase
MPSRKARIGLQAVRALTPGAITWDTEVKGFGVRLQADTPAYFIKTRVKGRQRWMTIGRHGSPWTPDTARKEALRLLVEASAGRDASAPRRIETRQPTLAAIADRYVAEHGPKLKPRSRDLYDRAIEKFIRPALGKRRLDELGPSEIGKLHLSQKATPRQANVTLTVLSSLLSWAMDQRLMPRGENPCAHIKRFGETKRDRFLSLPELTRLAEALDRAEAEGAHSIYALAAIRLLILTGARLNEVLTLEWSHVSLDMGRLSLPVSKTGQKAINLNKQAIDVLRSLPRLEGNIYVIVGHRHGTHMVNLHGVWDALRADARISDVRLHDLRHSFASFAVSAGASLPLIGKLLGHNSPSTTARYAHIADSQARDINTEVGDIIAGAMNPKAKPLPPQ